MVRAASGAIGGPWGRQGALGLRRFWTPLRVLLALTVVSLALAWLQKSPCQDGAWTAGRQYTHFCYSDVIPLYYTERLNEGAVPYAEHPVEYPGAHRRLHGGRRRAGEPLRRGRGGPAGARRAGRAGVLRA